MKRLLFLLLTLTLLAATARAEPAGDPRVHAPCFAPVAYTGSMVPTLMGGEVVLLWPVRVYQVKVGDIVCYYSPISHYNVLHRVVAIVVLPTGEMRLLVKGDHNPRADSTLVSDRDLVGRLVWTVWRPSHLHHSHS